MGVTWQWFVSNKNGPILPIFTKKFGAQSTPIPETKGLKKELKGNMKITKLITTVLILKSAGLISLFLMCKDTITIAARKK